MNIISFKDVWRYPSEHFALPEERRLPIYTLEETLFSASLLPYCEKEKRRLIATRIEQRLEQLEYPIKPIGELSYYFKNSDDTSAHILEASNFGTIEPIVGAQQPTLRQSSPETDDDNSDDIHFIENWLLDHYISINNNSHSTINIDIDTTHTRTLNRLRLEEVIASTPYNEQEAPEVTFCNYITNTNSPFDAKEFVYHTIHVGVYGKASVKSTILSGLRYLKEHLTDVDYRKINTDIIENLNELSGKNINVAELLSVISNNRPTSKCKYLLEGKYPSLNELRSILLTGDKKDIETLSDNSIDSMSDLLKSIKVCDNKEVHIDLIDKLTLEHRDEIYALLVEYKNNSDLVKLKDISAYLFTAIARLESRYLNTTIVDGDNSRLRATLVQDFKETIAYIQSFEPGFNFLKYYKEINYNKNIFIVEKNVDGFLVHVFKMIMGF